MKSFIVICAAAFTMAACASKSAKSEENATAPAAKATTTAPATTAAPAAEKAAGKDKKIHAGKAKATAEAPAAKPTEAKTETATAAAAGPGKQTCTSGSDTRIIELKQEGSGCELVYTKAGEAKTVATAKNEKAYCDGVSEKIMKKLQDAGFSCQ